ncbi:MAG: hypothetical protein GF364_01500 [Candidatus Lokiarchaeota archaeon]|nr:hypothetical protein [Candidatus Lokiarchaeota archaeon]
MSENDKDVTKKKSQILTVRIPTDLKTRIEEIAHYKLNSKLSRTSHNYLKMSEIMIVKEDTTKISWDNSRLNIFPERFIKEIFQQLNRKLSEDEQFSIWAQFGDQIGQYLNDIFAITNVGADDYLSMFNVIKALGWFDFTRHPIDDNNDMILIPKSFATKPFVYAMVYRIIKKTHFPPEWNRRVLNRDFPGDKEKDKKDYRKWLERYYEPTILNPLGVDDNLQSKHNFYYFRQLKVPKYVPE